MSGTVPVTMTYHTPNKREYFSLSFRISVIVKKNDLRMLSFKNLFFHFYFLNKDFSLNI